MENTFKDTISRILSVRRNRIIVGLIVFVVVVVVPIIVAVNNKNVSIEKRIEIDNFSEIFPDFPAEEHKKIEIELYRKVLNSGEFGSNDIPSSGALIQSDSLYSFTLNPSFSYGDFVVDIPSLDKKYVVEYMYGVIDGGQNIENTAAASIFEENDYRFKRPDPIDFLTPVEFGDLYCTLISTTSSETKSRRALVAVLDPPDSVYLTDGIGELEKNVMDKVKSYLDSFGLSMEDYKVNFRFRIAK